MIKGIKTEVEGWDGRYRSILRSSRQPGLEHQEEEVYWWRANEGNGVPLADRRRTYRRGGRVVRKTWCRFSWQVPVGARAAFYAVALKHISASRSLHRKKIFFQRRYSNIYFGSKQFKVFSTKCRYSLRSNWNTNRNITFLCCALPFTAQVIYSLDVCDCSVCLSLCPAVQLERMNGQKLKFHILLIPSTNFCQLILGITNLHMNDRPQCGRVPGRTAGAPESMLKLKTPHFTRVFVFGSCLDSEPAQTRKRKFARETSVVAFTRVSNDSGPCCCCVAAPQWINSSFYS